MRRNVIKLSSTLLLPLLIITSCSGTTKMPEIDENNASFIAKEITKRVSDVNFEKPANFSLISNVKEEYENKNNDGYNKASAITINEFYFDLTNLISEHYVSRTATSSSEFREYYYFDKTTSKYYHLVDSNGLKEKSVDKTITNEEQAKNNLIKYREDINANYHFINHDVLTKFDEMLKYNKSFQKILENENDQYLKLYFGSENAKSFQEIIESKYKSNKESLEGYSTSNENFVFKDDLLSSQIISSTTDLSNSESKYYLKSKFNSNLTLKYGGITIKAPNINEYVDVEVL